MCRKVTGKINNHVSLQLRVRSEIFLEVLLTILKVFLKGQFIQNCLNRSVSDVVSLSCRFCVLFSELFTLTFSKFCLHSKQPVVLNKEKILFISVFSPVTQLLGLTTC